MNYKVYISEKADQDFDKISDYIAEHIGADRSLEYIQRLRKRVINILSHFPNACIERDKIRYFAVDNYIAIYTVNEALKKVRVIMIAHQRSDYNSKLKERA